MEEFDKALGTAVGELSDKNYSQSLDFYRFWFEIGQTYHQIPSDQVFNAIWNNRVTGSTINFSSSGNLIHSTAHLILRFASDAESDHLLGPYSSGLRTRLCARSLQNFFADNLRLTPYWKDKSFYDFCTDANLIAHWANIGYVEETAIHNHILQSLISHAILHYHQAYAIIILFKLAGPTFEAYADASVIDRCFELLKNYRFYDPECGRTGSLYEELERNKQVRAPHVVKGVHFSKMSFQEVVNLRERGWEGLPPPPIFTTRGVGPAGVNQSDPAVTPIVTSLGLPSRDLEPQIIQPLPLHPQTSQISRTPPLEQVAVTEIDTVPASPATAVTRSPSISIASLSDFTIADVSDDETPVDSTTSDASDDELHIDPTAIVPHKTFYLEDGNVEVLCGNTLFRVTASTLSFHSPALRQMFAPTNLVTAESPNGCPRILSSDTAKDFATLLKVVYLPEFVVLPAFCQVILLTVDLPQIPRTGRGVGLRHILIPPPNHGKVRDARCPISDTQGRPRCIPGDFRGAQTFQAAWRERL